MLMFTRHVPAERVYPTLGLFEEKSPDAGGVMRSHWVNIHRKGPLTVGWEITYPTAYTLDERGYDQIVEQFSQAIKQLPEWTVVHKQDVYLYDRYVPDFSVTDYFGRSYEEHHAGKRHLSHRSYVFVTLATESLILKKGTRSGLFGTGQAVPTPKLERFEEFLHSCRQFILTLTSSGTVSARELTFEDWQGTDTSTGIIQKYMMLGDDSLMMSDIGIRSDSVTAHNKHAQCFVICESDQFQKQTVSNVTRQDTMSGESGDIYLSTGAELGVLFDGEHIVNHIMVNLPSGYAASMLDRKRRKMTSGMSSPDNRINAAEIGGFLDDMYSRNSVATYSCLNIIAWGPEEQKGNLAGRLTATFSRMKVTKKVAKWNAPVIWYAGIPSCAFEIGQENLMLGELESFLCFGAYETFDRGFSHGVLKLSERVQDVPVCIDTQEEAYRQGLIFNYNIFTVGPTGSGKSFFTNTYACSLYHHGECVFIIDVGDSYEGLCGVVRDESHGRDGQYYRWDRNHPFSFNAFIGWADWLDDSGNLRQDDPGVGYLLTVLQMLWIPENGWRTDNLPILRQTVADFADELRYICQDLDGEPVFDDYYRYVCDVIRPQLISGTYRAGGTFNSTTEFPVDNFIRALSTYAEGGDFGFLFNDRHPQDLLSSNFVVFEVGDMAEVDKNGPFYSICIFSIMHTFDTRMRRDAESLDGQQPFKQLIIEEAWKAIANEFMAPFLRELWKTARKYRTSAMVVTQELEDIRSSEIIRDTILSQSAIRFMLDMSAYEKNFGSLQSLIGLTDMDRNLIFSMNKRGKGVVKEVFVKLGNKFSGCYLTEVSERMALAFESNKTKKQDLLRNYEILHDMMEAIDRTIAERRRNKNQVA